MQSLVDFPFPRAGSNSPILGFDFYKDSLLLAQHPKVIDPGATFYDLLMCSQMNRGLQTVLRGSKNTDIQQDLTLSEFVSSVSQDSSSVNGSPDLIPWLHLYL